MFSTAYIKDLVQKMKEELEDLKEDRTEKENNGASTDYIQLLTDAINEEEEGIQKLETRAKLLIPWLKLGVREEDFECYTTPNFDGM